MTFEEARAQFPVLERTAYLNAGTNGPLTRANAETMIDQAHRDLADGRSGKAWIEAHARASRRGESRLRGRARPSIRPTSALTDSTSRGCAIVLSGPRARPRGRGRDHRPGALRPQRGGPRGRRSGRPHGRRRGRDPRGRHAAHAADRDLATCSGQPAAGSTWSASERLRAYPCSSTGRSRAGAIEVAPGELDFYTCRRRSGCAGRSRPARSSCATRNGCASRCRRTSRRRYYEPTGAFVAQDGARRFDLRLGADRDAPRPPRRARRAPRMAVRARGGAGGALPRAAPAARRGRDASGHSTLVSFRPPGDPTELVAALEERGVIVRELPGRNLVRVSVRLVDKRGRPCSGSSPACPRAASPSWRCPRVRHLGACRCLTPLALRFQTPAGRRGV